MGAVLDELQTHLYSDYQHFHHFNVRVIMENLPVGPRFAAVPTFLKEDMHYTCFPRKNCDIKVITISQFLERRMFSSALRGF